MIVRGLKPVFEEHGIAVLQIKSKQPVSYKRMSFSKASTAQDSFTDGENEMVFFPFDNGNPATWEGIIYIRGASGEATYSTLLDTTHEDLSQTEVYYEVYYPPDGGAGECQSGPCPILASSQNDSGYAIKRISYSISRSAVKPTAALPPRVKTWLGCSAGGCTTAAVGCLFSGPGYFKCLAGWRLGSLIGCGVAVLIS